MNIGKNISLNSVLCLIILLSIFQAYSLSNDFVFETDYLSFESSIVDNFDKSSIDDCKLVGQWDPNIGWISDLFVVDDLAFIACEQGGLHILNITDIINPFFIGSYEEEFFVLGIFVVDSLAYLACGSKLVILDCSDPSNIIKLGSLQTDGVAYDLVISGSYAYIADNVKGLLIIDVSIPSNPTLIKTYHVTEKDAQNIFVNGNYAFVCYENAGLDIVDISSPSSPSFVASFNPSNNFYDVIVKDSIGYIAAYDTGIYIVNFTDLSSPELLFTYVDSNLIVDQPTSISLVDDILFITNCIFFQLLNVSNPFAPLEISEYETDELGEKVFIQNGFAFLLLNEFGLEIINVTDSLSPISVSSVHFGGRTNDVFVVDDYAFIANQWAGVSILDVSDPRNPTEISSINDGAINIVHCIYVQNDLIYIGNGIGLVIIDITDIYNPLIISSIDNPGISDNIVVIDSFAYIASRGVGLEIYNISNPLDPRLISIYSVVDFCLGLDIVDNTAYLTSFHNGIHIIDITNKSDPQLIKKFNTEDELQYDIQVFNGYALVANSELGMQIFDIRDLSGITKLCTRSIGQATNVFIQGDWVYAISYDQGFFAYNWFYATGPILIASFYDNSYPERVFAVRNTFYVANSYAGLKILKLDMLDTDLDELPDYLEEHPYETNITNVDTDSDGYTDGDEVFNGFDPTDPNDPNFNFTPSTTNNPSISVPIKFIPILVFITIVAISKRVHDCYFKKKR